MYVFNFNTTSSYQLSQSLVKWDASHVTKGIHVIFDMPSFMWQSEQSNERERAAEHVAEQLFLSISCSFIVCNFASSILLSPNNSEYEQTTH